MEYRVTFVWVLQIMVAVILGQTLFFKFTGAPESIFIFSQLGVEPWGRYLTAVLELIAVLLLLIPRAGVCGGLLATALMLGALGSHLAKLGLVVQNDGGLLFGLALTVLVSSVVIVYLRRSELKIGKWKYL